MNPYPRTLSDAEIPSELTALVRDLARRILAGNSPQHQVLRRQLELARLDRIRLTGSGLFAYFEHGPGTEAIAPPDISGGDVPMQVRTLDAPAGCLLKVTGGRIDFLEIHTLWKCPLAGQGRGDIVRRGIAAHDTKAVFLS